MNYKKGFTLVEILVVVAILAILSTVIVSKVFKKYNDAKKETFETETKEIYRAAEEEFTFSGNKIYSNKEISNANKLQLETSPKMDYYVELDDRGHVTTIKTTNGEFQFNGISISSINDINKIDEISSLEENEIIKILNIVDTSNLSLEFIGEKSYPVKYSYKINGSSNSDLTKVKYEIYSKNTNELLKTDELSNKESNFSGSWYGYANIGLVIKAYDQYDNLMFTQELYVDFACFVSGTKVLTNEGYKNIEDIKIGDKVYSYNLDNNEKELKGVLETYISKTNDTFIMTINNDVFEVTPLHELYIIDKGWVRAFNVKEGDTMLSSDNEIVEITNIESKHYEDEIKTYNLKVEGNSNYFVTDIQVLVHNAGSPTASSAD